jgi:hypothetical protein
MLSWFPSQVLMPTASSTDAAIATAHDLTKAFFLHPFLASALSPLSNQEHAMLTSLATIFANCFHTAPPVPTPNPEL